MTATRVAIVACTLACTLSPVRADDAATEPALGATAHVEKIEAPETRTLATPEIETLRASFGDSFNPSDAVPGVVPVFSGVPYILVRGAPPAGTAQYYDGIPVPSLFHLALGPLITHPALVSELRLYSGVAPARYGRHTGAVFVADAPDDRKDSQREAELRLLDAHGLVMQQPQQLALHARVGYPQLMLSAIGADAKLSYWDYEARWRTALSSHDTLTLTAIGAADGIGERSSPGDDIDLQFHRWQARITRNLPGFELGSVIYLGYEQGSLGHELSARSGRLGPQVWVEVERANTRLRVGADMDAHLNRLRRGPGNEQDSSAMQPGPNGTPGSLPDLGSDLSLQTGPADFVRRAPLAGVGERNAFGAYVELGLLPVSRFEVETGVRADTWITRGQAQSSSDQRVMVRYHVSRELVLHAGVGTVHQIASSPLPIPGLSDYALDRGLQGALQSEAGADIDLPLALSLSATGFYHRYTHLVFMELILDCEGNTDPLASFVRSAEAKRTPLCSRDGLPQGDGDAYGVELLLKRSLSERLSGWLSYTLAWAHATASDGTDFVPQFDVRHVLNLILKYDWQNGFESGLRLHYRSGKPAVNTIYDFTIGRFDRVDTRLPPFARLDLNVAYHWPTSWGRVWLMLQWMNVTFSREATKRDCGLSRALEVECEVDYQPAIVLPNAGVRAEF